MGERVEFTAATKRLVAERAAHRCSFPDCDRPTVGPDTSGSGAIHTGVAAHIYSAAAGGPRGTGGLSAADLADPQNAIWLCAVHSRVVDANSGKEYPASVLRSYKSLRETRAMLEQQGRELPGGWLHRLIVERGPVLRPGSSISFGKLTLLKGGSASGKSALCEWLAAFAEPGRLWRWRNRDGNSWPFTVRLEYFNPQPKFASVELLQSGAIRYRDQGVPTPVPSIGLQALYVAPEHTIPNNHDDLEFVSSQLGLHEGVVLELPNYIDEFGTGIVKNVRFSRDEEGFLLLADVANTRPGLAFRVLSHSERAQVVCEFAIAACRAWSERAITLLLMDGGMAHWPLAHFERYAEHLSHPARSFQTLAITPRNLDAAHARKAGWQVVTLVGTESDVYVETD